MCKKPQQSGFPRLIAHQLITDAPEIRPCGEGYGCEARDEKNNNGSGLVVSYFLPVLGYLCQGNIGKIAKNLFPHLPHLPTRFLGDPSHVFDFISASIFHVR